jgi:hypothetical protein
MTSEDPDGYWQHLSDLRSVVGNVIILSLMLSLDDLISPLIIVSDEFCRADIDSLRDPAGANLNMRDINQPTDPQAREKL